MKIDTKKTAAGLKKSALQMAKIGFGGPFVLGFPETVDRNPIS